MPLIKICLFAATFSAMLAYMLTNELMALTIAPIAVICVLIWHSLAANFVLKALNVHRMTEASAGNVIYRLFLGDAYKLKTQIGLGEIRFYMLETDAPIAFSMGGGAGTGHVIVSSGLFKMLTRSEVGAVIAHEMGHLRAGDSVLNAMRLAQSRLAVRLGLSGLVSLIRQNFFSSGRSMQPEKRADYFSAKVFHDGKILASALKKLERGLLSVHWIGFDRLPFLSAINAVDAVAARTTYETPEYSKTAHRVADLLQFGTGERTA